MSREGKNLVGAARKHVEEGGGAGLKAGDALLASMWLGETGKPSFT